MLEKEIKTATKQLKHYNRKEQELIAKTKEGGDIDKFSFWSFLSSLG
jgi:hypothetical protein